jgi:hypothetical protein
MQTINSYTNQGEASFAVSLLQSEGFEAVLLDEGSFQFNYAGAAIPIRLQVPEEQATEAVEFLRAFHTSKPGPFDESSDDATPAT